MNEERAKQPFDVVERAKHYNLHPSGVEAVDLCEHLTFNLGNSLKYVWRAGLKTENRREDVQKAIWYLRRELSPPGVTLRTWLVSFLSMFRAPKPWVAEFDQLRSRVIAAENLTDLGLLTMFLHCLGDGSDQCLGSALQFLENRVKEM